jgi:hypothetical protein
MDIAKAMKEAKVNILGFTIAEGMGYGVVRALVDQPETAYEKLVKEGFIVRYTDVLAVRMEDAPGGLYDLTTILQAAGINIEYAYGYSMPPGAVLIVKVEQVEQGIDTLQKKGRALLDTSYFK